jgi:hypothetical protein
MVTLLAGIILLREVPKSLPTLSLSVACDLRKVSQTSYSDSLLVSRPPMQSQPFTPLLPYLDLAVCDYTNDLPNTSNPTPS